MTIYETLKEQMQQARKNGDNTLLANASLLISELNRKSKNPSDEEVVKTVKQLRKLECETLGHQGKDSSEFLSFLDSLLPKKASKEEVESWIAKNVDFSTLKNKMQAVGVVTKHFGSAVDGKEVREIIEEL